MKTFSSTVSGCCTSGKRKDSSSVTPKLFVKGYSENWAMKSQSSRKSIIAGVVEIIFQGEKVLEFKTFWFFFSIQKEERSTSLQILSEILVSLFSISLNSSITIYEFYTVFFQLSLPSQ